MNAPAKLHAVPDRSAPASSQATGPAIVPQPSRHDLEAERCALGAALLDGEALTDIECFLTPEDFYDPRNAVIFESMLAIRARGEPIDVITLRDELRARNKLNTVGGGQYFGELSEVVSSTSHAASHAKIVAAHAAARRIEAAGQKIAARALDPRAPVEELCEFATSQIYAATERRATKEAATAEELVQEVYASIERANAGVVDSQRAVRTGFADLDAACLGLEPGQLVVVGARPRVGKSAFCMQIARTVAQTGPVLAFSLEMRGVEIMERLLASEARVNYRSIRAKKLSKEEMDALVPAAERVYSLPLAIDDTPGLQITEIRSRSRKYKRRHPELRLIVIDYLQLVAAKGDTREERVGTVSRGLKALAKELEVPVIGIAAINRAGRDAPAMEHLRESGAIEADADVVMLLHREELVNKKTTRKGITDVILAKQRSAESEISIALGWTGFCVRFDDAPSAAAVVAGYPQEGDDADVGF
jgi:replicative DNA helicase